MNSSKLSPAQKYRRSEVLSPTMQTYINDSSSHIRRNLKAPRVKISKQLLPFYQGGLEALREYENKNMKKATAANLIEPGREKQKLLKNRTKMLEEMQMQNVTTRNS